MQGDDVALLQRELLTIGIEIPSGERQRSAFGEVTFAAVSRFPKEHQMTTTGIVNVQTALAINAVVDAETVTVGGTVGSRSRWVSLASRSKTSTGMSAKTFRRRRRSPTTMAIRVGIFIAAALRRCGKRELNEA
jgi:hypothetical protein